MQAMDSFSTNSTIAVSSMVALTITTVDCRTKGKKIGRSRNRHGGIVVIAMVLPFVRVSRHGHDDMFVAC